MPTWNQQEYLPAAIDSVLAQTYENWELIIVDDKSGQATRDILATITDPRIRKFRFTENRGTTHATNYGLAQAKGEWASYISSDDLFLPEHLETMLGLAKLHDAECVLCAFDGIGLDGERTRIQSIGAAKAPLVPPWPKAWHPALMAHKQTYSMLGLMIRTKLWQELGGLDPAYPRNADWKLLLQLTNHKVYWTPKPLCLYRAVHPKCNRIRISGRHRTFDETERLLKEFGFAASHS